MPERPPLYPSKHLLWGSLREFTADKLAFLERAHARFGDTVRLRMTALTTVMVSSPEDVQRVLADNYKSYEKPFVYRVMQLLVGNGLITAKGEEWLKHRRIMQPGFHRQHMQAMVKTMVDVTRQEAGTLAAKPSVNVFDAMMHLTLRIAGLTLVSVDLANEARRFGDAFVEALGYLDFRMAHPLAPVSWVPTKRNRSFLAAVRTLRDMSKDIIEKRAAKPSEHGDLLDLLLAESAGKLDTAQLIDEVLTILLAGHETTATTLSWALYFLSQRPDLAERVYAEAHGNERPYTEAFIKETMRLRPPVWLLQRRALADDVLGGFAIKKGDFVVVSPYVVHRRAASWADPLAFDPERFLREVPKHAYIPFSHGPRKCIGDVFATLEATAVLSTLLQTLRFSLPANTEIAALPLVTLRPKDLTMGITRAPLPA